MQISPSIIFKFNEGTSIKKCIFSTVNNKVVHFIFFSINAVL